MTLELQMLFHLLPFPFLLLPLSQSRETHIPEHTILIFTVHTRNKDTLGFD
jgi:hypothetical protein